MAERRDTYIPNRETGPEPIFQPVASAGIPPPVRLFSTGATRDVDDGKYDYEAFLSPLVMEAYGRYMHACRMTATGMRDGDNWQLGISLPVYMKSLWRHFFDFWKAHRHIATHSHQIINALAIKFNTDGYLHELLKATPAAEIEAAFRTFEDDRRAEIAARQRSAQLQPPPPK